MFVVKTCKMYQVSRTELNMLIQIVVQTHSALARNSEHECRNIGLSN